MRQSIHDRRNLERHNPQICYLCNKEEYRDRVELMIYNFGI